MAIPLHAVPDPDEEIIEHDDLDEEEWEEDDPDGEPVDLHSDDHPDIAYHREDRQVVPLWMAHPWIALRMARGQIIDLVHATAFHGLRVPYYWVMLAWWSLGTLARACQAVAAFVYHPSSKEDLLLARAHASGGEKMTVVERHRKTRQAQLVWRAVVVIAGAVAVWVWPVSWWSALPGVVRAATVVVAVPVAGWWSRPLAEDGDGGLLLRRTKRWMLPPIDTTILNEALLACAIPRLTRAIEANPKGAIAFPNKIQRNATDSATLATIVLPHGVTGEDIMGCLKQFSAALERAPECVVLAEVKGKPATWLSLFITDEPLSSTESPKWALEAKGAANWFEPIPIGVDIQGRPMAITFDQNSFLVAALAGHGKTVLSIELASGACLDPRVEIHIADCKGGGDWKEFRKIAHFYRCEPDMEEMGLDVLRDLKAVQVEMKRRYKMFTRMDDAELPDNRVYDELVTRHRSLRPILYIIDECQEAFNPRPFEQGEKDGPSGKDISAVIENLIRRGRAVGIVVLLITQKPDRIAIPTSIRDLLTVRFCGRVTNVATQRMVLGDHYAGPSPLNFSTADRGLWIMSGVTDEGVLVRAPYLDAGKVKRIVARIYQAKKAGDWLSGMAAGEELEEDDTTPQVSILEHLVNGWPADRRTLQTAEAAGALQSVDDVRYRGWGAKEVTTALKPFGVPTSPKYIDDGQGLSRRGVSLEDLEDALRRFQSDQADRPAKPVALVPPMSPLEEDIAEESQPAVWPALGEVDDDDLGDVDPDDDDEDDPVDIEDVDGEWDGDELGRTPWEDDDYPPWSDRMSEAERSRA